jgi:hypothetical protein
MAQIFVSDFIEYGHKRVNYFHYLQFWTEITAHSAVNDFKSEKKGSTYIMKLRRNDLSKRVTNPTRPTGKKCCCSQEQIGEITCNYTSYNSLHFYVTDPHTHTHTHTHTWSTNICYSVIMYTGGSYKHEQ